MFNIVISGWPSLANDLLSFTANATLCVGWYPNALNLTRFGFWIVSRIQKARKRYMLKKSISEMPKYIAKRCITASFQHCYARPLTRSSLRTYIVPGSKDFPVVCASGHVVAVIPWERAPQLPEILLKSHKYWEDALETGAYQGLEAYRTELLQSRHPKPLNKGSRSRREWSCLCGAEVGFYECDHITGNGEMQMHHPMPFWNWVITNHVKKKESST